jgi:predicted nuclease of predicted toxin-antitoxin system
MDILIDMNLSPTWCEAFAKDGITAWHWSTIGDPKAPDTEIMQWAKEHTCIVFTNDLDFGTLLALTKAESPSVFQVRTQNLMPEHLYSLVLNALKQFETLLEQGAIIILDENKLRARILPLK